MTRERDLFANFERMRREIDELFGDVWERASLAPRRRIGFTPAVDVYYCGDPPRVVVTADIAGVDIGDIALDVRGSELIIAGERKPREREGRVYQQVEIEAGAFRRHVQLGVDVVAEEAKAAYRDGILRVELPIAEEQREVLEVEIESADDES